MGCKAASLPLCGLSPGSSPRPGERLGLHLARGPGWRASYSETESFRTRLRRVSERQFRFRDRVRPIVAFPDDLGQVALVQAPRFDRQDFVAALFQAAGVTAGQAGTCSGAQSKCGGRAIRGTFRRTIGENIGDRGRTLSETERTVGETDARSGGSTHIS